MPSGKEINSTQRRERRIMLKIDADASSPSILIGAQHASLVRNGVGDYSISFTVPYARAPQAMIVGAEADTAGHMASSTVSGCDIEITDLAGAAADNDVICEIIGWDATDEI